MRPSRKADIDEYYKYIMSQINNILAVSVDAQSMLDKLKKDRGMTYYNGEIKHPEMYLGAQLQQKTVARTSQACWSITSSNNYITAAVEMVVKGSLKGKRWKMKSQNKLMPMVVSSLHEYSWVVGCKGL